MKSGYKASAMTMVHQPMFSTHLLSSFMLAVLAIGCRPAPMAQPLLPPDPLTRICGEVNWDPNASGVDEASLLQATQGRASRDSLGLHLFFANGSAVTLQDAWVPESDVGEGYQYRGLLPTLHSHLVEISQVLSLEYLLFNLQTGAHTRLDGPPRIAPNERRFLTAAGDPVSGELPNASWCGRSPIQRPYSNGRSSQLAGPPLTRCGSATP